MFRITLQELEEKACRMRRDLIDLLYKTGSGHLDTSLSLVEVWLALVHSDFFRFDPRDGAWSGRDRVFLSEGHACPIQYLIGADLGYYSRDEVFAGLRRPFTPFQGHTQRNLACGLENSNGSLGIGIWQAYGHALGIEERVFCIAGDGEFQEPASVGLLTAPHYLKPAPNFKLILNYNHLAQDSPADIGPLDRVAGLYGWQVIKVNGHNFTALGEVYHQAVAETGKPSLIVCDTVKGKGGDPALEGVLGYHGRPPKTDEEYRAYISGLEASRRV